VHTGWTRSSIGPPAIDPANDYYLCNLP